MAVVAGARYAMRQVKMMDFVVKMMDLVFKRMDFVLKMMEHRASAGAFRTMYD